MPLVMLRFRKEVGRNLRRWRLAAKITLEEAGREVGRSKSAVLAWEKGESDITAPQLAVLCLRYGCTPNQVILSLPASSAGRGDAIEEQLQRVYGKPPRIGLGCYAVAFAVCACLAEVLPSIAAASVRIAS